MQTFGVQRTTGDALDPVLERRRAVDERGGGGAEFLTTNWSDVVAAGDVTSPRSLEALGDLCRRYWYPLYAYVRGCGFSEEDAKDTTQAFFEYVVETNLVGRADATRGRFRWFVLKSLQNFLRNRIAATGALKRGGGTEWISWDAVEAEQQFLSDQVDESRPEDLFDLAWARSTLGSAYRRLSEEFNASGRAWLFEQLKPGLTSGSALPCYEGIARQLGISVSAVKVAMHRLRQRFRQLVRAEVESSVSNPAEIDDEFRHLIELLAR
ncbi:MAG: sigma-70 family RNA polymerase sigma factor [Verrucomicrobiales bacterium]|nr:sigma-70 family RNA polymerase sigma factor [Verrucomicrobiales bacterium]